MGWEWSSFPIPSNGTPSPYIWSQWDMKLSLWVVQDPAGLAIPGIPTACGEWIRPATLQQPLSTSTLDLIEPVHPEITATSGWDLAPICTWVSSSMILPSSWPIHDPDPWPCHHWIHVHDPNHHDPVNSCIWLLQHHDPAPICHRPIQSVHCPLVVPYHAFSNPPYTKGTACRRFLLLLVYIYPF